MWAVSVVFLAVASLVSSQIDSITQIKIDKSFCKDTVCREFSFPSTDEILSFDPESANTQKVIRFKESTFTNFPLNMFLAFSNVTELDMRNCSIAHMTWENFLWATSLKVLLLSNNLLTKIDELTFSYALNIQFLWLESNQIRYLVSESFKGLTQLKYLSLQDNQITHIPEGLFDDLRLLEIVTFANNRIKYIQNNLFTKCPKLLSADLKTNQIRNISDDAFKNIENLVNLDISYNAPLRNLIINVDVTNLYAESCSLRQVNIYGHVNVAMMSGNRLLELYFSKPESLQRLDLGNNSLQQIASLTRAENLEYLDISDNPKLELVPNPWGITSLEKLNMKNTGLKEFPESILGHKRTPLALRFLDISNNSIKEIDPRLFSRMENVTNFYFHGNDWNCFHLRLLMEVLIKVKGIAFSSDKYDPKFPGEYIDGVKCMFRAVEDEQADLTIARLKKKGQMNALDEVDELRNELKTIVRFYEDKFDQLFGLVNDLKARLDYLAAENSTIWEHITLTT